MRAIRFVLPALLLTCALSLAQQPPLQPQQDPNAAKLDEVLGGWEKAMTSIQSLHVKCQRTTADKVFQSKDTFKGTAMFVKSNVPNQHSRASLELFKDSPSGPRKDVFEKFLCTGTFLYEYSAANKVIRIHELPPPKQGQIADDNLLSFLFGMKAVEAKQRYQLTYMPPPDNAKYYHYVKVQAKLPQDKADFTEARLVLLAANHLPRQVWFHQPNGNEVTWDFTEVQAGVDIPLTHFGQPQLPTGWQWDRVPAQAKPKVRSSGQ